MKLPLTFIAGLVKKVVSSGLVKPLPGSGIIDEVSETISEIKEKNNYKRLIRLGAYIGSVGLFWYLIGKGMPTEKIMEILSFCYNLAF